MTSPWSGRETEKYQYLLSLTESSTASESSVSAALARSFSATGKIHGHVRQEIASKGIASTAVVIYDAVDATSKEPLGAVVGKSLTRTGAPPTLWLDEALFYEDLRDKVQVENMKVPRVLYTHMPEPDSITIVTEYIPGYRHIQTYPERLFAARIFGRFALHAHRQGLYSTEWLHQSRGIGLAQAPGHLEELLTSVVPTSSERQRLRVAFDVYFERRREINEQYSSCLPTLCHGDANQMNVLVSESRADGLLVVDWARVSTGMIGEDLVRLILPSLVSQGLAFTANEMARVEEDTFDVYASELGDLPTSKVWLAYEIRSVVLALGMSRFFMNWTQLPESMDKRAERIKRVCELLRFMADRAERLILELGEST